MTKITLKEFDGGAGVSDGVLAKALREFAQHIAIVAASGVTDLTADNSGGTAGSSISGFSAYTLGVVSGSNCVTKVAFDAAVSRGRNGLKEIIAQAEDVNEVVGAFDTLVDSMGGQAADGTIAEITATVPGANTLLASANDANTVGRVLLSRLYQATLNVNALCVACGKTPITWSVDNDLYVSLRSSTFAAASVATGNAVNGSAADIANGAVLRTEFIASQTAFSNAVASLAAKLDSITDADNADHVCDVVAA